MVTKRKWVNRTQRPQVGYDMQNDSVLQSRRSKPIKIACVAFVMVMLIVLCGLVPAYAESGKYSVQLSDDESTLLVNTDNFLEQLAGAMPGDSAKVQFEVCNNGKSTRMITFAFEDAEAHAEKGQTLLDVGQLKMSTEDGEVLYEGSLRASSLGDGTELGTLEPGETMTLVFEVSIPTSVGNEAAMADDVLKCRFTAAQLGESGGGKYAKTGSDVTLAILAAAALMLLGVILLAVWLWKHRAHRSSQER